MLLARTAVHMRDARGWTRWILVQHSVEAECKPEAPPERGLHPDIRPLLCSASMLTSSRPPAVCRAVALLQLAESRFRSSLKPREGLLRQRLHGQERCASTGSVHPGH